MAMSTKSVKGEPDKPAKRTTSRRRKPKAKAPAKPKTDERAPAAGDEIATEQAEAQAEAQETADKKAATKAEREKRSPSIADPEIYDEEGRERRDADGNLKRIEPTQERLEAEAAERQASLEAGTG